MQKWPAHRNLWPTPRATDGEKGSRTDEGAAREALRRSQGFDLGTAVRMWPTPNAGDGIAGASNLPHRRQVSLPRTVAQWPTPTADRYSGLQSHGVNAILGSLNPTWVEWLMGFPSGWTDLGR
jgi:DNA (cytosine-5)-methyltransferase 1